MQRKAWKKSLKRFYLLSERRVWDWRAVRGLPLRAFTTQRRDFTCMCACAVVITYVAEIDALNGQSME